MLTAEYYIEQLNLLPHPEGGYYKEMYRSGEQILVQGFDGVRSVLTSIYFLLKNNEKSHLHRIKSDEQWFYHGGTVLEIIILHENKLSIKLLGTNIEKGESLHITVPAGAWFGSRVKDQAGFVLVSCVVAPGFDFGDFELALYKKISREFPAYDSLLKEMCIE
ncbi:cupin domain-containing protein [Cytophaga aurantiaca]|uniref:cupin domain-containing protein n=1 Tax=Cytophaga aurantiaca TaxID=29530 RepID=UPI00037F0FBC|nr:cupin domain-containing protein [Cytophaga aurantiaca]